MSTEKITASTMPAGETWTVEDDGLRRLRHMMAEAEVKLASLRGTMNDQILRRRLRLQDGANAVCPVCGVVLEPTAVKRLPDHPSITGRQCRGSGMEHPSYLWDMTGGL